MASTSSSGECDGDETSASVSFVSREKKRKLELSRAVKEDAVGSGDVSDGGEGDTKYAATHLSDGKSEMFPASR